MNLKSGCLSLTAGITVVQYSSTGFVSARAPQVRSKIAIQQEHCHVAPDTVTLFGDFRDRLDHRLPEPRLKSVELEYIRPSWEVGIPSASENCPASLMKGCGLVSRVVFDSPDEVFRMLEDPRVVGSDMVRHEIEDKTDATICESISGRRKPLGPPRCGSTT